MTLTPEQIDRMTGKELNALIESEIYKSLPLTDEEWELLRTAWSMTSPGYVNSPRPIKVPRSEPDSETMAMYRLGWAQDFSGDDRAAASLVHRMRQDGWLFSLYEVPGSGVATLRIAAFEKMPTPTTKGYQGKAEGNTDALAISRAALKAKLMEGKVDDR